MPIRIPVVNGTPSLPASSIVFSRSAGSLSGVRPPGARPQDWCWCSPASAPGWDCFRATAQSSLRSAARDWRAAAGGFRATPARTWLPDNAACCDSRAGASVSRISGNSASGLSPSENSASVQPSFSPCLRHRENFVGRHGVRAGLAGIAAEGAVSAIIAAQIGQRDKHLARVGDDAGTILFFERARSRKQFRQNFVVAAQAAGRRCRRRVPAPRAPRASGQLEIRLAS